MSDTPDATAWHDDDTFWETFAPFIFGQERWAGTATEIDQVLARLEIPNGATVLDLGCGPGRHSLELARRGFRVTGVDRTDAYLKRAKEGAQREGLEVEFVNEDMRDFVRPDSFDAVINMFTAFGYFEDPEDDGRVVRNVHESLRDGGSFLIDVMGKEVLARNFREHDWSEQDGVIFLEERKLDDAWGWINNRWILIKDQQRFEFRFGLRVYSATELGARLHSSGFDSVEIFGDLGGAPYDHNARRLVAIARKT